MHVCISVECLLSPRGCADTASSKGSPNAPTHPYHQTGTAARRHRHADTGTQTHRAQTQTQGADASRHAQTNAGAGRRQKTQRTAGERGKGTNPENKPTTASTAFLHSLSAPTSSHGSYLSSWRRPVRRRRTAHPRSKRACPLRLLPCSHRRPRHACYCCRLTTTRSTKMA